MSNNMHIYSAVRAVPKEAQKTINGGRMNGKTDINPMWRIKMLTELFGPCGFGWKYTMDRQWLEPGADGNVKAFVNISLYVKMGGEWSEAIPGNGGSSFVEKEKSGLHTSDECYKMALTDAISVACKALGFGANIYWEKDPSKYDAPQQPNSAQCPKCNTVMAGVKVKGEPVTGKDFIAKCGMCNKCYSALKQDQNEAAKQ